ncbi:MAG: hypothetical protein ABSF81_01180 [Bacteroidales bacterium]
MDKSLEIKLKGMLWDLPSGKSERLLERILQNPQKEFQDQQLLVRGLNSLNWYDLIQLLGHNNLLQLLSESVISKLHPRQRQIYYKNAKELLSKYTISSAR